MGIFLKVVLVFFCLLFTIIFSAVGIVPSMILSPTSEQVAQQLGIEEVEFDSQAQITQIANQVEAEIDSFANGTTPTLTLSNEELTALIIDQLAKQTDAPELTNISVNVKEENGQPSIAFVATLNSNSLPDDMQDLKDLIGDDTEITIGADIGLIEGSNGKISLGFNQYTNWKHEYRN